MSNFKNLIGKRFGRLVVVKNTELNIYKARQWLCLCDCGNYHTAMTGHLNAGHIKSCGCLNHGWSDSNIYGVWEAMKQRCTNKNDKAYKNYGGRGIKVCDRWLKFENFLKDMGEIPKGMSLDRINNNDGYYKENCKFSTREEQNRNTRRNMIFTYRGKTQCLMDHCKDAKIRYNSVVCRILDGWTPERALSIPIKKYKRKNKN